MYKVLKFSFQTGMANLPPLYCNYASIATTHTRRPCPRGSKGTGSNMNHRTLVSLRLGHLCPSIVPRFIDDDRDLLGGALRNLDLCYGAAANLRGWAA